LNTKCPFSTRHCHLLIRQKSIEKITLYVRFFSHNQQSIPICFGFLVLRKNVSRPRAHSQLTDVETSEMRKDVFHVLQNQTKTKKKKPSRNQRAPINERRLRSVW
jgi:GTP cyclohydrolase FolE2